MRNPNLTTLRVLLVLSCIGSGMSMLSYLLMALMMPQLQQTLADNPGLLPEQFTTAYQRLFEVPRLFFAACAVLNAFSLAGVIAMWRLRPTGFHFYTLAQLLLLALPLLFLGRGFLGIGDFMFTLLFVGAYYLLLRSLGVLGRGGDGRPPLESDPDSSSE